MDDHAAGEPSTNRALMAEYDIHSALLQHEMEVVLADNLPQASLATALSVPSLNRGANDRPQARA